MKIFAGKQLLAESEQYPEIKDSSVFTDEFVRKYFKGIDSVKNFATILADRLKKSMESTDDDESVNTEGVDTYFDASELNKLEDEIYVKAIPGNYDLDSEPYNPGDYYTPPSGGQWVDAIYSFKDVWVYFEFDTVPRDAVEESDNYTLYDLHIADILNQYLPKRKSKTVKENRETSMVKLLTQKEK